MRTYLDLTFGLMHDGHFLCFIYGLLFIAMPLTALLGIAQVTLGAFFRTTLGLRLLTAACNQLCERAWLWPVGDLICRLVPRDVARRHQSKAYSAAMWLEAYDDQYAPTPGKMAPARAFDPMKHWPTMQANPKPTRYERNTAASARLLLSLPWV